MSRYLRYLRIAWSVGCAIACVLLIALWVRSYSINDLVQGPAKGSGVFLQSLLGRVLFGMEPLSRDNTQWHMRKNKVSGAERIRTYVFKDEILGFRAQVFSGAHFRFHVPHWSLVILAVMFVTVPWIRQLNWRFSLSTLLIATTLVAAVLGLVVYAARK